MTEFELLNHAKKYIDQMANGLNPLTGEPVPDGDLINNVRISRCLFYVSGVMQRAIENGLWAARAPHGKKAEFALTAEQAERFSFSEKPIPISEIRDRINALIDDGAMKKLQYKVMTDWLLSHGLLETYTTMYGKEGKRPTPEGEKLGILLEQRQGMNGVYYVTLYDLSAQRFLLDNLAGMVEEGKKKPETPED